jgi:hypothetical protein
MSSERALQAAPAPTQQASSRLDVCTEPREFRLGDPLPAAVDAHMLARIFGKSIPTIHRWAKNGKLRRFELRNPVDEHRWSGRLLQAYLDGGGASLGVGQTQSVTPCRRV